MQLRARRLAVALGVAGLCAVFALQCADLARRTSPTFDECGHLGAGTSYWANGDYRLTTANLFFSQRLAGLGPWLQGYAFPSKASQLRLQNNPDRIGEAFVFESGHDPIDVLAAGRLMITALGVVLGVVVFWLATHAFGDVAGLGALALYVLCPPIVANASIVTTDLATTLWFTVAIVAYWRLLCEPSLLRALGAGAAIALLLLTKSSAVGFVALGGCLVLWRGWRGTRPLPWQRLAGAHAVMALAVFITVWGFFGFAARPGGYEYDWEILGPGTRIDRAIAPLRALQLFPDPFIWEFSALRHFAAKRYSFFAGEHYYGGSWLFFPAAFLLKTPPATIVLFIIAAGLSVAAWRHARRPAKAPVGWPVGALAPLWVIVAGYSAMCIASRVNIGHRHLLPIYPAACVLAGGALAWLLRRGRAHAAAGFALLAVGVLEAGVYHGRQLAYFSPLAGGPRNGYRWFVDSTNDWGANLPEIATWQQPVLAREPGAQFYVGHLGVYYLAPFGVHGTALRGQDEMDRLRGGYYILSTSALLMGYVFQPGPYNVRHETMYQRALHAAGLGAESPADRAQRRRLAVARLSAFCRHRTPDGRIGDVYFVFRLSDAEVERAIRGPLPPGVLEPEQHSR